MVDVKNDFRLYIDDLNNKSKQSVPNLFSFWNVQRHNFKKEQTSKKKMFFMEIKGLINMKNLNELISNDFYNKNYSKNYHFQNMLNKYSSGYNRLILTQSINPNLIYEKEQLEILKSFLNEYMMYILIHKLPIVDESFKNVNIYIEQISLFQDKIKLMKDKMNKLKIKFLNIIALTYLKKQKLQNTKKVLSYLKAINHWKEMYLISLKPLKTRELSLEEIIQFIKEITMSKYESKSTIIKLFIESIDNQKHKHKNKFEEEFLNIFLETKSEIQIKCLYEHYLILNGQNTNIISSFINYVLSCFII